MKINLKKIVAAFIISSMVISIAFETDVSFAKKKSPPAKVYGLRAVKVTNASVSLRWRKAKKAKKYIIYRAAGKYGKFLKRTVTVKPQFKDYRVKRDTVYRYYVRAYNGRTGRMSAVVKVKTKFYADVVKRWYIGAEEEDIEYNELLGNKNVVATLHYDGLFRVEGSGNTTNFSMSSPWFFDYVKGLNCNRMIKRVYIGPNVKAENLSNWFVGCENLRSINRIPATANKLNNMFYACSKLRYSPAIPANVEEMSRTFYGCKMIKKAPALPKGVEILERTFANCTSLVTAPEIPKSAENINLMFLNCKNLKTASKIPAKNHIEDAIGTYKGCKNLTGTLNVEGDLEDVAVAYFFKDCSTSSKAKLKIRYDKSDEDVVATVDEMYKTKSPNSNIEKTPY